MAMKLALLSVLASASLSVAQFPKPAKTSDLPAAQTIAAGQSFDGGNVQFDRNPSTCNEQSEGGNGDAVFVLEDGASLSNVVIGPNNGEGVHCLGSCSIENVWWIDVCEDALTLKGDGDATVSGGGAANADDKVIQHNGVGTITVSDFTAQDVGKLYRSCGNCKKQGARTANLINLTVKAAKVIAGVNGNLGDKVTIEGGSFQDVDSVCDLFEGNSNGDEPTKTASGPDGKTCSTGAAVAEKAHGRHRPGGGHHRGNFTAGRPRPRSFYWVH